MWWTRCSALDEETYHEEVDGHADHIHGYGGPLLGNAHPDEECKAAHLKTPVDAVAQRKAAGISGAGFHAEGEVGGHDVVAAKTDDVSYGQRDTFIHVGQQDVIDGILYQGCRHAYHAEAYQFEEFFFHRFNQKTKMDLLPMKGR